MKQLNVLIADDDLLVRVTLERSMVQWGYKFVSAPDGESACALLRNGDIDICVLDWEMPAMTGLEVCKWIRANDLHTIPYVILHTSKDRPEDIQAVYEAGADEHIAKPASLKYLHRQLATLAMEPTKQMPVQEALTSLSLMEISCLDINFLPQ